jgi:putative exosortase-associated protein (TIGR04073 family)
MAKKIFCLLIVAVFFTLNVYAQDYNALRKLGRGAVNLTLAGVEIPRQMIDSREAAGDTTGDIMGIFLGIPKGILCFLGRTALGAYELVTFPFPPYKPLVKPEFIFSEEDD